MTLMTTVHPLIAVGPHLASVLAAAVGGFALGWLASRFGVRRQRTTDSSTSARALHLGQRFRLRHDVDRYPHFIAAAGSTGILTRIATDLVALRMDAHLPGSEEWNNELWWDSNDSDGNAIKALLRDAEPVN